MASEVAGSDDVVTLGASCAFVAINGPAGKAYRGKDPFFRKTKGAPPFVEDGQQSCQNVDHVAFASP